MLKDEHQKYMRQALKLAQKAAILGEVPIGCVIVYEGKVIGRGYNRRKTDRTTLAHAEIEAIRKACRVIGDWRLEGCTMYVTLEPCQMCAGAIVQSRIDRVVMGTDNPKAGCAGSIIDLLQMKEFNHRVEKITGVMQEECREILQTFFRDLRIREKQRNYAKLAEQSTDTETTTTGAETLKAETAANASDESLCEDSATPTGDEA